MIASGSTTIQIHSHITGECVRMFKPKSDSPALTSFSDLSWSADNKYVLGTSTTGNCVLLRPNAHQGVSYNATLLPMRDDGIVALDPSCARFTNANPCRMMYANAMGAIYNYDISVRSSVLVTSELPPVDRIACGPHDASVLVACPNAQIYVVDATNGLQESYMMPGNKCATSAIAMHLQNPYIAGATSSGTICAWDRNAGELLFKSHCYDGAVTDMSFFAQDDFLVAVGHNEMLRIYDMRYKDCAVAHMFHGVRCVTLTPDNSELVLGTDDGCIVIVDMRYLNAPRVRVRTHNAPVNCIRFERKDSVQSTDLGSFKPSQLTQPVALARKESNLTTCAAKHLNEPHKVFESYNYDSEKEMWKDVFGIDDGDHKERESEDLHSIDAAELMQLVEEVASECEAQVANATAEIRCQLHDMRVQVGTNFTKITKGNIVRFNRLSSNIQQELGKNLEIVEQELLDVQMTAVDFKSFKDEEKEEGKEECMRVPAEIDDDEDEHYETTYYTKADSI